MYHDTRHDIKPNTDIVMESWLSKLQITCMYGSQVATTTMLLIMILMSQTHKLSILPLINTTTTTNNNLNNNLNNNYNYLNNKRRHV
jgi:hypothetical protein